METVICAIIAAVSTIAVSVVSAVSITMQKKIEKSQKEQETRAERRRKESILSLEMMSATMELSVACCNALTGGHNNGNVADAKMKAEKAHNKYIEFERTLLSESLY